MDTQRLRLQTISVTVERPRGVQLRARLALEAVRMAVVRALRLRRHGAKPYTEDSVRWAYLSSIHRIGPRL